MERDDERTWTELVESFHASTGDSEPTWPDAENVDSSSRPDASSDSSATTTRPGSSNRDDADDGKAETPDHGANTAQPSPGPRPNDDEHFVPPAPPPIPRTDMITMLAWAGVFGTPVLFAGAYLLGQSLSGLVSMIAVIAFIGGFGVLISRLRGHDPHDPDNGAVV